MKNEGVKTENATSYFGTATCEQLTGASNHTSNIFN